MDRKLNPDTLPVRCRYAAGTLPVRCRYAGSACDVF